MKFSPHRAVGALAIALAATAAHAAPPQQALPQPTPPQLAFLLKCEPGPLRFSGRHGFVGHYQTPKGKEFQRSFASSCPRSVEIAPKDAPKRP
jgi:hypothetical protein